jgi:hypothetical protein
MPQAVDSLTSVVEQLSERLRDLESRITELESVSLSGQSATSSEALPQPNKPHVAKPSSAVVAPVQPSRPPARSPGLSRQESSAYAFSALGKAALGFAGAFLLRAIAESGWAPKLPIVIAAIVYACVWMLLSARTSGRFASVTYALTSTLILSPMLWEATVRFEAMSASAAAGTLALFMILTLSVATARGLQLISWIAALGTVSTAIALIIGTRELIPLAAALLVIAAASELTLCLGYEVTFRVVPAVAADFSIWLLIYILGSGSVPEGYSAAAPEKLIVLCAMLPAIYAASIAFRSFVRLRPVSVFETVQGAASMALAAFGILSVSGSTAAHPLGLVFLAIAAVCYWGTLSRFIGDRHSRNRRVSASWAAALVLAATFLVLPNSWQVVFLCVASLLAATVYTRNAKLSLGLHASFYLASATAVSSLGVYVWNALAGTVPQAPDWRVWVVALAAGMCYAVESRTEIDEGRRRLLWLVPAGIVAFTIAGWGVSASVRIAAGRVSLAASHLSMIRTIIICVVALALGLASRRRHIELRWIAYAAVALGTLKLLLEDLRFGNPASLVVSFVFYGLILILLPRLTILR